VALAYAVVANAGDAEGEDSGEGVELSASTARTQSLRWGKKWMSKHGWGDHLYHHWNCGHYFKSLCHWHTSHPAAYYDKPWYAHYHWLDYSDRLAQAHTADEEETIAFHEAVKELHEKVMEDRDDREKETSDLAAEQKDKYDAIKEQIKQEREQSAETIASQKEKRDRELEGVDASYLERIANVSGGYEEYQKLYDKALEDDKSRKELFHKMIGDMKKAGLSEQSIQDNKLAFLKQEKVFQSVLTQVKAQFHQAKNLKAKDAAEAKQALTEYEKEIARNSQKMAQETVAKEDEQNQLEQKVAAAADHHLANEGKSWEHSNGGTHYARDLADVKKAEAKKQGGLEAEIADMKKKEKLHAEAMAKKAKAEQVAAQKAAAAIKEFAKPTLVARMGKNQESLAEVNEHKLESAKSRQSAFFRALSHQADAEFQSMPSTA